MKNKSGKKDRRFEEDSNKPNLMKIKEDTILNGDGIPSRIKKGKTSLWKFSNLLNYKVGEVGPLNHITDVLKLRTVIIDTDDRSPVFELEYPYNCICLLLIDRRDGSKAFGTGFMISKRCVISAGHCVFANGDWAKKITVIPGAKGNTQPFGQSISTTFKSVKGWTSDKNDNFDYGAIVLKSNSLYNKVGGFLGFKLLDQEKSAEISGYPKDKDKTQWKGAGKILRKSKYRIYYDVDTLEGNSGSPIFIREGQKRKVVGIHTFGDNPNHAIRIRQELINLWQKWSKL